MLTANDERQFVLRDQVFLILVEEEKLLCNQISPGQTPVRSAPCVLCLKEMSVLQRVNYSKTDTFVTGTMPPS